MAAKCAQLGVKISSLLDRELNELEARRLRSHVEGCADCASEYRELRSARLSARTVPQHEPPADLWGTVNQNLDRVEQEADGMRSAVRAPLTQSDAFGYALALAVALSLVVGLAIMMFQMHRHSHHHRHMTPAAVTGSRVIQGAVLRPAGAAPPATPAVTRQ